MLSLTKNVVWLPNYIANLITTDDDKKTLAYKPNVKKKVVTSVSILQS